MQGLKIVKVEESAQIECFVCNSVCIKKRLLNETLIRNSNNKRKGKHNKSSSNNDKTTILEALSKIFEYGFKAPRTDDLKDSELEKMVICNRCDNLICTAYKSYDVLIETSKNSNSQSRLSKILCSNTSLKFITVQDIGPKANKGSWFFGNDFPLIEKVTGSTNCNENEDPLNLGDNAPKEIFETKSNGLDDHWTPLAPLPPVEKINEKKDLFQKKNVRVTLADSIPTTKGVTENSNAKKRASSTLITKPDRNSKKAKSSSGRSSSPSLLNEDDDDDDYIDVSSPIKEPEPPKTLKAVPFLETSVESFNTIFQPIISKYKTILPKNTRSSAVHSPNIATIIKNTSHSPRILAKNKSSSNSLKSATPPAPLIERPKRSVTVKNKIDVLDKDKNKKGTENKSNGPVELPDIEEIEIQEVEIIKDSGKLSELQHECKFCKKKFATEGSVNRHIKNKICTTESSSSKITLPLPSSSKSSNNSNAKQNTKTPAPVSNSVESNAKNNKKKTGQVNDDKIEPIKSNVANNVANKLNNSSDIEFVDVINKTQKTDTNQLPEKTTKTDVKKVEEVVIVKLKRQVEKEKIRSSVQTLIKNFKKRKALLCNICDKKFLTICRRKAHLKYAHLLKEKVKWYRRKMNDFYKTQKLKCSKIKCEKYFNCEVKLLKHEITHWRKIYKNNKRKSFECLDCKIHFYSKMLFQFHCKTLHGIYLFKCPQEGCSKKFGVKAYLERHIRRHNAVLDILCINCGLVFTNRDEYKKHQMTEHGEELDELIDPIQEKLFSVTPDILLQRLNSTR